MDYIRSISVIDLVFLDLQPSICLFYRSSLCCWFFSTSMMYAGDHIHFRNNSSCFFVVCIQLRMLCFIFMFQLFEWLTRMV